jgi:tyrosine-protein phosphatase SIW14
MRYPLLLRYLPLLLIAVLAIAAIPAELSVEGIPNFHQVNARLFRGGQPSMVAWPELAALGVTTVIDLCREREHPAANEARAVEAAGMRYVRFPMNGFETPSAAQIAQVLHLVETGDTVFVHCKAGMDRTGVVVAAYRIAREHWANQQALDEAESLGMHWYSSGMKRFILNYRAPDPTPTERAPSSGPGATPVLAP